MPPRPLPPPPLTPDDFVTSFLHFSLFSTALWDLPNSRPVLPRLPLSALSSSPFHHALQDGLARPDEGETWPYHCSLHLFTIIRRSSCGPFAGWILAWTSSLVNGLCMRCVVSCSTTSFPWLVFFFGALLWGSMIHKHTRRWMWQGSASVVSWSWEKYSCQSKLVSAFLINAAVACAILVNITGLEPSSVITEPRYFLQM